MECKLIFKQILERFDNSLFHENFTEKSEIEHKDDINGELYILFLNLRVKLESLSFYIYWHSNCAVTSRYTRC